mgnify:CR=1 FL=1
MYKYFNWPHHGPTYRYQPRFSYEYTPLPNAECKGETMCNLTYCSQFCYASQIWMWLLLGYGKHGARSMWWIDLLVGSDYACFTYYAFVCSLNKCSQFLISLELLKDDWFHSSMCVPRLNEDNMTTWQNRIAWQNNIHMLLLQTN